jgi:hypothetical protein
MPISNAHADKMKADTKHNETCAIAKPNSGRQVRGYVCLTQILQEQATDISEISCSNQCGQHVVFGPSYTQTTV